MVWHQVRDVSDCVKCPDTAVTPPPGQDLRGFSTYFLYDKAAASRCEEMISFRAESLSARPWTNSCANESLEIALSANLLGKASCVQGWRTSATTGRQQANSSPQRASTPPRLLTIETRVRSPRNRLSRPCPRSAQCWHLLGWPASSRTNKAVRRIGKRWYSLPCHVRIVRIQGRKLQKRRL